MKMAVWVVVGVLLLTGWAGAAPGDIDVYIDGSSLELENPAVIEDGRTLVPMRDFFEGLGAKVQWEEEARMAVGVRGDTVVVIPVGCTVTWVNGEIVTIDVPAQVREGRTYVPLRFVGESLGDEVNWDGDARRIDINTVAP